MKLIRQTYLVDVCWKIEQSFYFLIHCVTFPHTSLVALHLNCRVPECSVRFLSALRKGITNSLGNLIQSAATCHTF